MAENVEITHKSDNPPFLIFIGVAFGIGLVIILIFQGVTAVFSPKAQAQAQRIEALTPGEVVQQGQQIADEQALLDATRTARVETATGWQAAKWRITFVLSACLVLLVGGYTVSVVHLRSVQTKAKQLQAEADTEKYQVQARKEAENPVHTPVGPYLSEYTQEGVVYVKCWVTGITVRADDKRGMQVLSEHRAPLVQQLLLAMIAAQRDISMAQVWAANKNVRVQVPDEWLLGGQS